MGCGGAGKAIAVTLVRYGIKKIFLLDKDAKKAMTRGLDYLKTQATFRPFLSGPRRIYEADITHALNSEPLNDPSIKYIDPDMLTSSLSVKMPFIQGFEFFDFNK